MKTITTILFIILSSLCKAQVPEKKANIYVTADKKDIKYVAKGGILFEIKYDPVLHTETYVMADTVRYILSEKSVKNNSNLTLNEASK